MVYRKLDRLIVLGDRESLLQGEATGKCAAMRKLLQLAYGVLKSGMPFDEKIVLAS
ncbi:MAG: hypothetical protein AB2993_07385 (plasmid) [Candidatus Symbiodolus clandestinus]